MWPKVIAQLVELLPHLSRLVPMADKFLSSKANSEKANEAAMVAMAEGVRGDLGQVLALHKGIDELRCADHGDAKVARLDCRGIKHGSNSRNDPVAHIPRRQLFRGRDYLVADHDNRIGIGSPNIDAQPGLHCAQRVLHLIQLLAALPAGRRALATLPCRPWGQNPRAGSL